MISPNLEHTLRKALEHANMRCHEYATLEHLMLALTEDEDAVAVLRACNVDLERIRTEVEDFIDHNLDSITLEEAVEAKPTQGFQRTLRRAVAHVQSSGANEVTGANILVAMFSERESHVVWFLQKQDMTRLDAVSYISHGVSKVPGQSEPRVVRGTQEGEEEVRQGDEALEAYCVNLNEKAKSGKTDPLVGRQREVERTIQVLCRRTKNNPLLVGDPGVGKTAIAEGLARRITENDVPEVLAKCTIWAVDMGALLAGTRYRGDSEKEVKSVITRSKRRGATSSARDQYHHAAPAASGIAGSFQHAQPARERPRCMARPIQRVPFRFEKDRACRALQNRCRGPPSRSVRFCCLNPLREFHAIRYTIRHQDDSRNSRPLHPDRKLPDKRLT